MSLGETLLGHPNLVSMYRFNDNLNDSKGLKNLTENPSGKDQYGVERFSKCFHSTGLKKFSVHHDSEIVQCTGSATVAFWHYVELGTIFKIHKKLASNTGKFSILEIISGSLKFHGSNSSNYCGIFNYTGAYSGWQFIVITWSDANAKLYLNGRLMNEVSNLVYNTIFSTLESKTTINETEDECRLEEMMFFNAYDCFPISAQLKYLAQTRGLLM